MVWIGRTQEIPFVVQNNVCLPKCCGGLGIRKLRHLNSALQAKQVWRIFNNIGEWRDILVDKYIRRPSLRYLLNDSDIPTSSVIRNRILKARTLANSKAKQKVGDGENILFWHDNWLIQGPLINKPMYDNQANTCIRLFRLKVSDYRMDQGWRDLSVISNDLKPKMVMLNSLILNNNKDELIWEGNPSGSYSTASGYNSLWNLKEKPLWAKAWLPGLTPKIKIFFWLMLQDKILTLDNLAKRGQYIPNRCILCKHYLEMVNHIFIHCTYSMDVLDYLTKNYGVSWCNAREYPGLLLPMGQHVQRHEFVQYKLMDLSQLLLGSMEREKQLNFQRLRGSSQCACR